MGKRGSVLVPGSELELASAGLGLQVIGSTFQGSEVHVGNNNVSIGAVHGNVHLSTATAVTHPESVRIPLADWLSSLDFSQQQVEALQRRTEGTFTWLLETSEFTTWKNCETGGILLCIGKPGAGKTTFASFVIDCLQQQSDADSRTVAAVCYVYCRYHTKLTLLQLLELILKQLILQCPSVNIDRLEKLKNKGRRPTVEELTSILQANFTQLSNVFIVIDAMDECFTEDVRYRLLSTLQSWNSAKILITSRPIPTIESALPGVTILIISPNATDIRTHIRARTRHNPNLTRLVPKVASADLETKIVEQADGIFLLVELHIQHLSEQMNVNEFLSALETLPKEASATYARALERINQQNRKVKQIALYALSWIFYAWRPLKMIELQYGIASTRLGRAAEENDLDDEVLIISACAGLLVVNQDTKAVGFIHYTVQEYIEKVHPPDDLISERKITKCCLNTISLTGVQLKPPTHPLIEYTTAYWGFLVHSAQNDDTVMTDALLSLENSVQFATIWAAMSTLDEFRMPMGTSRFDTHAPHPLHIAAAFSLDGIAQILLKKYPLSAGQRDPYGRTPLHFAAQGGHVKMIKMLLDAQVDVDTIDSLHRTPLLLAAEFGRSHDVAAILLETEQVDVNAMDLQYGSTPLLWGAVNGNLKLVQLFLEVPKIAVNAKNVYGESSLALAVRSGNPDVVKTLLTRSNTEVNVKDHEGRTPLHWAATFGHSKLVQLLLDNGKVDVNAEDTSGRTPLSIASANGCAPVVQRLLCTNKVQVDRKDNQGRTPLSLAAEWGHLDVVKPLLDMDRVDVNAVDSTESTPLSWAARKGHLEVVMQICGNRNVALNARNKVGETPLFEAIRAGHTEVVKFLLTIPEVDASAMDKNKTTPFSAAAENGDLELVKLLAEKAEHDIDCPDNFGTTPLGIAAFHRHSAVVQFLIDTGKVNVNAVNLFGITPLWAAAEKGDLDMVHLLAEHDVGRPGTFGDTPLCIAVRNGHHAVVRFLLDTGRVDTSAVNERGETPLWLAAAEGHLELVKLLSAKAEHDIDRPNNLGDTPLGIAVRNGHHAVVRFLLNTQGVDVSAANDDGETPLWSAAENGHLELVRLLREKAEHDIDRPDKVGNTPLGIAAHNSHHAIAQFLLESRKMALTAELCARELVMVAYSGDLGLVRLLLERPGYSIELPDKDGTVPFSAAAFSGNFALVKFLFSTGRVDINATDANHESVFSYAASGGNAEVVNFLLQTGKVIDINAKDALGRTAFVWAAEEGQFEVLKLLLDLPTIDVNAQDLKGLTAVIYAAEGSENPTAILDLLLNDPRIAENLSLHHLRPIKRTNPQPDQCDSSSSPAQNSDSDPVCEVVDNVIRSEEFAPPSVPPATRCDDTGPPSPVVEHRNVAPTQKLRTPTLFVIGSIFAFVLALLLAQ